jgi:hypothetical protein
MNVVLDERGLLTSGASLEQVLVLWTRIADRAANARRELLILFDRQIVETPGFLSAFNSISLNVRNLSSRIIFGRILTDWRAIRLSDGSHCRLGSENGAVSDCGVCEAYARRRTQRTIGLLGFEESSYAGRETVEILQVAPPGASVTIDCGSNFVDFERIGKSWNCFPLVYSREETRPPRDGETCLGNQPERFERTGRFERNGRRVVYREIVTGYFYYVDNLHYGLAAHLEVFDADEQHVAVADLDGNHDISGRVPGRVISW